MATCSEQDDEDEVEEEVISVKISVKASQAVQGLPSALEYFESLDPEKEDDVSMKILHTKNLLRFAKAKQAQTLKQKSLKDMFNK